MIPAKPCKPKDFRTRDGLATRARMRAVATHSAYNLPEVYPQNAMRSRWAWRISSGVAAIVFCALSAAVVRARTGGRGHPRRRGEWRQRYLVARRLAGAAGAALRQPHRAAEPGVDSRGGVGDFEHALCFGRIPADEPRRPDVRAGPPGLAAGLSAFTGERAQAGADAGRRFDCGGQLYDRRKRDCCRGDAGGRARPCACCRR